MLYLLDEIEVLERLAKKVKQFNKITILLETGLILTIKQEKHDVIKLPAKSKLDSIVDIISQAMEDGDISSIEFHLKVLREVEKYRKLKADIRKQAKIKVKLITK